MYNYYAGAGFLENSTNAIKQYAPILFVAGTGLFIAMMFGPDRFGNLGGGNLIPLLSIGLMAIGGYVIFANAHTPVITSAPLPSVVPVPHHKAPVPPHKTSAKYAYYY
jgi:hypothetical protein